MKILWVNPNFLHPTTKGGQIRTLEMVRQLHRRHEVHYVAFEDPAQPEGVARSGEYCTKAYPVTHRAPARGTPAFAAQVIAGLVDPVPVAVGRYRSRAMRMLVDRLMERERFDSVVCDFLAVAPNISAMERAVLFQHNVETIIWRRHAETAAGRLRRAYMALQARRMYAYEGGVCRRARHVVAVSEVDASRMRAMFGVPSISDVSTGVDLDRFAPPPEAEPVADLVFTGSMDWMPNIDGILWFAAEVLPLIRRRRPECRVAVAGRSPAPEVAALGRADERILITGTVDDIRPYLWGAPVSIVPLRVGGGTRLKIFEAVAARRPVVSTTVGAEGLPLRDPAQIRIADTATAFADACVALLDDPAAREKQAGTAWELVAEQFSWERIANQFERILDRHRTEEGAAGRS